MTIDMKKASIICKSVSSKESKILDVNSVLVKDGIAYVSNLHIYCKFALDLPDGNYDRVLMEKCLVEETNVCNTISEITEVFEEKGVLNNEIFDSLEIAKKYVSKDSFRTNLRGVVINSNNIYGTNANILYFKEVNTGFTNEIVLPLKVIEILKIAISPIKIFVPKDTRIKIIRFECEEFKMDCRITEAVAPNIKSIIPQGLDFTSFELDKKELTNAIKFISPLACNKFNNVKFNFSNKTLLISAINSEDKEEGSVSVKCEYEGKDFKVTYNYKMLLHALKAFNRKENNITLEIHDKGTVMNKCIYFLNNSKFVYI